MNTGKYRTFSVPVEKKKKKKKKKECIKIENKLEKKKRIDKNWQEIRKKHILQITMY